MSYTHDLSRADDLKQQAYELHSEPSAQRVRDRASALDHVTWHRLLRERASDPQASQAERDAAAATLAAEGVTL